MGGGFTRGTVAKPDSDLRSKPVKHRPALAPPTTTTDRPAGWSASRCHGFPCSTGFQPVDLSPYANGAFGSAWPQYTQRMNRDELGRLQCGQGAT